MSTAIEPHLGPIDRAILALTEYAAELLTSNRPSRFAELQTVTGIAMQVQRLRVSGVDDVSPFGAGAVQAGVVGNFIAQGRPFNDGADLNREIIMVAQSFLEKYMEAELAKKTSAANSRHREVGELSDLMDLRSRLVAGSEQVPPAIQQRIDRLLQRIGEPDHEPAADTLVPPEHVRGRSFEGPGQPDGSGVGEPLAEREAGDGRAG